MSDIPSSRTIATRVRPFHALPADEAGVPPSASPVSRAPLSASLSAPVLVIDDSEIARDEVSRVLRAAGFHVVALRSPIGATQAIVRQKARVVVVDVFMPTLRGDRLLTLLRKNQRLGHLGIILMSGHAERELDPLQLELQADAVVAKRHLDRLPALVKRLAARER